MVLAAGFATGVLGADAADPARWQAVAASWLGIALLVRAWLGHRRAGEPAPGELLPRLAPRVVAALLAAGVALGFADMGLRFAALDRSSLPELEGEVVSVSALVAGDPRPVGQSWNFLLKDAMVAGRPVTGRIAARAYGSAPQIAVGDRVSAEIKVVALDAEDPFDQRWRRKGAAVRGTVAGDVVLLAEVRNPLLRAANHFRTRMFRAARAVLSEKRTGLLMGLVIGDDRLTGDRIRDEFRAAGLSHLTAVSGANLAMVLAALAALLTALRISRRAQILSGLLAIVLFAAITRWEPSVLRASVMAALALSAFLFGRLSSPLHVLGLAFGGLLAFDPMLLWSIGFQLSFAATAGILVLRKPLLRRMPSIRPLVAEALAIGVSAQIAVFPLIAAHFDRISIAALPANLAAVALVPPVTVLGLAAGVIGLFSSWLAGPLVWWAGLFVAGLEWIARVFGRSPAAQLDVPDFGLLEVAASYLLIAAAWLVLAGRIRPARLPALLAVVMLTGAAVVPALGHSRPDELRVTFFDVGAGDAALVESPAGVRVLIDGGPDPHQVASTLRRWGFERVDLVVATHLHADHVGGLRAVVEGMEVGLALYPGVGLPEMAWIGPHTGWEAAGDGQSLRVGDVYLQVLGPTRDLVETAVSALEIDPADGTMLNDSSVVLKIEWGDECVLFPADLEETGQQDLLDRRPDEIECTIMKAPHHGSARLLPEFVGAVDPEWVTVSVGTNRHGHPTAKALDIFRSAGAEVLRTDRQGDVVLELTRSGRVHLR